MASIYKKSKGRKGASWYIAYTDEADAAGRVADFHSLRASLITLVVRGGASVKTAQALVRHSTPPLTIGRYTKAVLHDQAAVVALPRLDGSGTDKRAERPGCDGDGRPPRDDPDGPERGRA